MSQIAPPLMLAQEIRELPSDKALVTVESCQSLYADKEISSEEWNIFLGTIFSMRLTELVIKSFSNVLSPEQEKQLSAILEPSFHLLLIIDPIPFLKGSFFGRKCLLNALKKCKNSG